MRRNYVVLLAAFTLSAFTLYAQSDSSGVYLTGSDFKSGKLSLAIDCRTEKHRIKLNDFFGKPFIIVKHKDSSYKLQKGEIFGFKTCDGTIIRFSKKKELVLLNPSETILIYRHDHAEPPKGKTNVTNYYFSTGADSPVLLLTKSNLKKAFPDQHLFHQQIDLHFRYNTELAAYDAFHKMYKLNWIFSNNNR